MERISHDNTAPFEKRLLALSPHELEQRILDRQSMLRSNPNNRKGIEKEIGPLERRLSLLQEDMQLPTIEDVRRRQVDIDNEFARLDIAKNYDWFIRESLRIRLRILGQRKGELASPLTPTIRIVESRAWKEKDGWGGKALPPYEWEQLSPRLVADPQANLNEAEEYKWYLGTLSDQKRKEVASLAMQMRPIDDNVRAVVCIPTYKEGGNIYRTLANYQKQVELGKTGETERQPLDYSKLRIVVFDNYPEGGHLDQTQAEVQRFMRDHPEVPVNYIKAQFSKGACTIGHIRNMLTASVIESSIGRKGSEGDLIYISNDGDMPKNAIKPTYIADIINEFDTHPNMDALAGKIDMPEGQMAQVPVQLATRRLWQYMDSIFCVKISREPFLVGRNSSMRLKMVAAVGNYPPTDSAGEDVEIGNKIKWARSWNKHHGKFNRELIKGGKFQRDNRVRYVSGISLDTDPRRDVFRIICGERIKTQYSQFERNKDLRAMQTEDLMQQAVNKGHGTFNRALFELEAGQIYWDSVGEEKGLGIAQRISTFTRAMGLLGAKWEVKNGKFKLTDTRKLEGHIWVLQFRQFYQAKVEEWLRTKLRLIQPLISDNNRVISAETSDGKRLIIRASRQKGGNKFASEKMILDLLENLGIPVPHVIAIDYTKRIIPDRSISVSERLPGKTFTGDSTKEGVVDPILLRQIGSMLKRIHNVEIGTGFGFLDEQGKGSHKSWEEFVLDPFRSERLKFLVDNGLINEVDLRQAINFANSKKHLLTNCPRKLLHGDFALSNILQENNKLTGIIDFENAKAGDPLWDIAHFAVYERARISGDKGMQALLTGYGNSSLLANPEVRTRYYLYKLSDILYGLEWYSYHPHKQQDIERLNKELKYTLERLQSPTVIYNKSSESDNKLHPVSKAEVNALLQARFAKAVEWFKNFYNKGLPKDQEFAIGEKKYRELSPEMKAVFQRQDQGAKNNLFHALKKDPQIASSGFSDQEIRRQIDRLVTVYKTNPVQFEAISRHNPAFRAIVYLRNRGKLQRYEAEYANLPKEINFRQIVLGLARKKLEANKTMNILDEGGTFDVALQQLTGAIKYHVPGAEVKLASIAGDNMAIEFADCHKYLVDHRMADVHRLNEVFGGEKRTLIISQASYKFFWDPIGAIIQTANALENGGWAFLGDIRNKVSYNIFEIFRDQNGRPIHPQTLFEYLNTLNSGYTFYTGMHTSLRDGEPRQVMTIAIKKESDKDLILPISYRRTEAKGEWQSPLAYVLAEN